MRGGPVYIVKPKYIFKHPFNKYDLSNTNRESQNQQLTDYFNYGFNEDTMNIYGKLVKRFIEVLDHHKNLEYFNQPSELMRLNDEIPMDFGGFCKFHDPWIVDNQTPESFHDGENLMRYFIMMIFANASRKVQYPLIQFITKMYKKPEEDNQDQDTSLFDIIEQIGKNLETKYLQTMEKIIQKANEAKNPTKKSHTQKESNYKEGGNRQNQGIKEKKSEREEDSELKKEKSALKEKSSIQKSSEESSSEGSESEEKPSGSELKRKREKGSESRDKGKKKDRHRSKSRDRKKKEKKEKHKSKKVKKEKSHKRSRSRDKKKKHQR